jgi:hypothetical protein
VWRRSFVVDPASAAGRFAFGFVSEWIQRIRQRRRAKKFQTEELSVNNPIVTQILLAVVRHAMTALAPLGVTVSDDWMVQTTTVIVGLVGFGWSVARKLKK